MKKLLIYIVLILMFIFLYPTGKILFFKWKNQNDNWEFKEIFSKYRNFIFKPSNCIFKVTFPEEPEIKDIYSKNILNAQRAQLIKKNHVLRATCMEFIGSKNFEDMPRDWFIKTATEFAEQEEMINPVIEHEEKSGNIITTIRGSRNAQGRSFKFKYVMYHSGKFRFTVFGGGLTSGYPQSEILPFLDSVERKKIGIR